jgi:hypothetical protein
MEKIIEHLIATVGGLKAVMHNNQAKRDISLKEIIAK